MCDEALAGVGGLFQSFRARKARGLILGRRQQLPEALQASLWGLVPLAFHSVP